MFNLTDTMVLALLKKGLEYEIKNADMEMNFPIAAFTMDEDNKDVITCKCRIESGTFKISQD